MTENMLSNLLKKKKNMLNVTTVVPEICCKNVVMMLQAMFQQK